MLVHVAQVLDLYFIGTTLEYCTNIAVYSIIRRVQDTNRKHGHSMLETAALDYPLYISRSRTYRIINALPGI